MACELYLKRLFLKNKVVIHATIWMKFKNLVLSERIQSQKSTFSIIPFIHNRCVQNRQMQRDRKEMDGCPESGGGGWRKCGVAAK